MRILVTGGAGSLGMPLARILEPRGDVLLFDREFQSNPGFETIEGDIRAYGDVEAAFEGVDTVIHCAALTDVERAEEDPGECYDINVLGTYNVCRAAVEHGAGSVVFFSSREVYGEAEDAGEEDALEPVNVYGRSKAAAESIVRYMAPSPLVLRPTNIIGTGKDVVSRFAREASRDGSITLHGDPGMDILHLDDFLPAAGELIGSGATGTYNVGSGQSLKLSDIASIVVETVSGDVQVSEAEPRMYVPGRFSADVSRLNDAVGYRPGDQEERIRQVVQDRTS